MKEGLIKDSYELIIKEIQTAVTVAYILAVGIGMLFNHQRKLIGKTKDVVFLLDEENVYAIPINSSVKEIRIKQ